MAPSSEGPNPLRPYYKPPSIGIPADTPIPGNTSTPGSLGPSSLRKAHPSPSFGSSARGILSDLDYEGILGETSSRSTGETVKKLLDQSVWKYSSVFMAQPFEVAKTVLQVYLVEGKDESASRSRSSVHRGYVEETYARYHPDDDDEDDEDEPSYFTSNHTNQSPRVQTPSSNSRARSNASRRQTSTSSNRPSRPSYQLDLRRPDSVTECLSQLWAKEGAWGFWKGTNVTFLYGVLLKGIETWTRSMLAALFNLPDPGLVGAAFGGVGGLDIIDSPSPFASLVVAVSASAVAGVVLAPLDMIRTRWTCPPTLLPLTLIHTTLPTVISTTTPLLLRSNLGIDPLITPTSYSVCTFLTSTAELFLRLPFETVLRRGQMKEVQHQQDIRAAQEARGRTGRNRRSSTQAMYDDDNDSSDTAEQRDIFAADPLSSTKQIKTIVPLGQYYGILPTMWRIARDEGTSTSCSVGGSCGWGPDIFLRLTGGLGRGLIMTITGRECNGADSAVGLVAHIYTFNTNLYFIRIPTFGAGKHCDCRLWGLKDSR
ncbi:hypothetical protein FH972_024588 [Carpinus fangiana]|uniref:Mitochondrial carrier n=1 Tax=Carpinus fangiana TaxID=176857 RepID=A0A5N6L0Z1_9ROSI|nr:hypothetical protein FH972_024588 [Carpinus fangiana]